MPLRTFFAFHLEELFAWSLHSHETYYYRHFYFIKSQVFLMVISWGNLKKIRFFKVTWLYDATDEIRFVDIKIYNNMKVK
jgi:hypothetical protein